MRTISTRTMPGLCDNTFQNGYRVANPAYMKVGEEICCVTFPGENKGDPGWDHAKILRKVDDTTFVLEEVRDTGYRPAPEGSA